MSLWRLVCALSLLTIIAMPSAVSLSSENNRMQEALEILSRIPTGRGLIDQALTKWNFHDRAELLKMLRWGEVSRTDAVLTRHFNPLTGVEARSREVTITIRQDQKLQDIVLDVAHELTHATERPDWDPYDPSLTAIKYI